MIVGEKVCQFKGFMQQDAQEFMAFLLDGLHEVLCYQSLTCCSYA